jgi:hypothetical protein
LARKEICKSEVEHEIRNRSPGNGNGYGNGNGNSSNRPSVGSLVGHVMANGKGLMPLPRQRSEVALATVSPRLAV